MNRFILVLIILCFSCTSNKSELPILSYKIDVSGERQTYTITYEGFVNQEGASFSTASLNDKIYIANFFFTRCPSICPPMRTQLIGIAKYFEEADNFMIISHTIDPESDSVSVLKSYSDATEISSDTWQFLRSSIEMTKAQANQYMTNFKPNEAGTDFYHSSYVALVDTNLMIRGFYNILVPEDIARLKVDTASLLY